MSSAGSRLDRLVTLLDSGSTALVRNTAATQLADIQKSRPEEIFNLLNRVVPHLRSKTWETRVAAAKALGGIVENAEKWDPNPNEPPVEEDVKVELKVEVKNEIKEEDNFIKPEIKSDTGATDDGMLTFATLDLTKILEKGKILLGSSGAEYDYSLADLDPAERLAAQKKNVTARLGLGGEWMSEEIVNEKDFASAGAHSLPTPRIDTSVGRNGPRQPIHSPALSSGAMSPLEGPQIGVEEGAGLSKRQINALKRKAKANAKNHANKVRVVDLQSSRRMSVAEPVPTPAAPTPHPVKKENSEGGNGVTDYFSLDTSKPADDTKIAVEYKGPAASPSPLIETTSEEMDWPFERLCEILEVDLFDHNWEIRHGAAMGLREIVRVHGKGAGRIRGKSRSENDAINQKWLEDLACRLCCIFMLDRFGDYVSDNVVAPIRETTSQTMGALLLHLSPSCVYQVYRTLYRLVMQEDLNLKDSKHIWQVCHGGMLGLKYLSAVRTDLLIKNTDLLDGVVRAVMRGLADLDDDVRAVSAATLIPIAEEFITLRPEAVDGLINVVWECLTYLKDDLSASTGSVMDLLAKLCSFPQVLEAMRVKASADPTQSFALLVPRLYPFLRHTITSVRSAVLRALLTFLNVEGEGTKGWVDGKALRLVFQNLLVERNEAVLSLSLDVWFALIDWLAKSGPARLVEEFTPHLQDLVTLLTTPIGVSRHPFAMNPSLFIRPSGQTLVLPGFAVTPSVGRNQSPTDKEPERKRRRKTEKKEEPSTTAHNVDGHMIQGDIDLVGFDTIVKTKISGAKALGKVIALWPQDAAVDMFMSKIIPHLSSPSGSTQMIAAMIIEEYHKGHPGSAPLKFACMEKLLEVLNSDRPPMYQDIVSFMHIVRSQCHALLNTFATHGKVATSRLPILAVLCQGEPDAGPESFSIEKAEKIVTDDFTRLKKGMMSATKLLSTQQLNDARNTASAAIAEAKAVKAQRDARVFAAAAAAYIASGELPKKVNNVIKGVMESVKLEECVDLQKRSALAVADLVGLCSRCGKTNVSDKVTKNLMAFLCVDTSEVPIFHLTKELRDNINTLRKEEDRKEHDDPVQYERDQRAAKIKRLGAKEALEALAVMFGADLFTKVPKIWSSIEAPLHAAFDDELPENVTDPEVTLAQEVIDGMSQLRALLPKFHQDLHPAIIDLFPLIIKALQSSFSVIRYAAAKCFATICSVIRIEGMTTLVEKVLPMIGNAVDLNCRQGAVECVYHLIHVMEEDILPYVVFLIVPILGRMSDSDNDVRLISTTNFATLVKLVPLEAGIPDPPGLSAELLAGRDRERQFIAQMLDVRKVEPFELPVAINATLRSYQQEGVNWLAFLNKYHLHGILCDDMGLGKTLQTICMVASDHYLRAEEFKKSGAPEYGRLPSLIVCPPSLSGHWAQEIKQFAPFLTAVCYVGSPAERARVKQQILAADIVITSYDICRNDNIFICSQRWNYCVLDEGHIIKNAKAKLTQAVKKIAANHRLILSGTPIQNNVLELWSLFDFLMPGFLGTEKVFLDRFAKPIAASRNSKSNSKEQEAGALAIEALHKQVLPFLLRRLKEEVLDDLPPKIIQNYYCELSELQKKLYEDFAKKQAPSVAEQIGTGDKSAKTHIFQALQYMRKLCNSPALVLNEKHPQYEAVKHQMLREGTTIRDAIHAPKLGALRDLLVDMGIGAQPSTTSPNMLPTETSAISQHRALIFCQLKEMCDIVENDVFKKLLPGLTFMRMDGSTPATKRQDIVTKFNGDPSIDVLLLTTHVGGLGLNLTGADTVIFVEHDWNPQKDMQAMDRAHRIGQKKVVNVYRLITRGTLEEKIMSLQRFKLDVASTVINQQNAGLQTMETDQLLDLFNISETIPTAAEGAEEDMVDATTGQVKQKGAKGVLDDMGELWDESQYTDEYDLGNFIASLK